MISPTHSSRMRRFSHTTQLRKHHSSIFDGQSTDMVKLPALRAITKSIKYNDLSFATNRDLRKLRKQPEQIENIEEAAAHHTYVGMRKKYDNANREREALQKKVVELEARRDKFLNDKNRMTKEKVNGGGELKKLESELNLMKGQLEQSEIQKKVMLSMIDRLKKDKVVYDLRKFNMEKELVKIHKHVQIINRESASKMEQEQNTKRFFSKYVQHIQSEKRQREEHVGNVSKMLMSKQDVLENGELRKSSMMMIAVNTLQDKDSKQKNWYNVYLCHRFVERLLRDKMTREMMKFNVVEMAFKNIKTATGVNNGDEMVKKYLNKENTYGELLEKISDNQREIEALKKENEEMMREKKKLKREREALNANKIQSQDLSKEEKELQIISEKALNGQKYYQKISFWLEKGLRKFAKLSEESASEVNQLTVSDKFKLYLSKLQACTTLDEPEDLSYDRHGLHASENIRINFEEDMEPVRIPTQNNHEQNDFLDDERFYLHRNNQKFMRELKRKVEQERKAAIEAMPKKKAVVEQKPKPASVESA